MKRAKILFVKTPMPLLVDDALEADMGLLCVATFIKQQVEVETLYLDLSIEPPEILYETANDAKIICFSTFTANYCTTIELVKSLRQRLDKDVVFIAGGHHATALPQIVAYDFDYVIVGEGERACAELVENIIVGKLPKERIIVSPCIEDLNTTAPIDYGLVKIEKYTRKLNGRKSISILTSRGCPYCCEFCNSTLTKMYGVRFRSAENVHGEILYLNKKYGTTAFRIQDDIFSINRPRLRKLAELLEPLHFDFRCFARIDNIDSEMVQLFKRIGISHVSLGIESGSQKILDSMNKGINIKNIIQNMRLIKDSGLISRVFLIVGFPGETYATLDETISLIKAIKPDEISVYPLIPYPGTPLYNNPEKYGITYIDKDFSKYYQIYGDKKSGYVFETKQTTISELLDMRNYLVDKVAEVCPWAIDIQSNR